MKHRNITKARSNDRAFSYRRLSPAATAIARMGTALFPLTAFIFAAAPAAALTAAAAVAAAAVAAASAPEREKEKGKHGHTSCPMTFFFYFMKKPFVRCGHIFCFFAIKCDEVDMMMNAIWLFLFCGGILAAVVTDRTALIFPSVLAGASDAVELCIGLAAFLGIWCGMLRLAECSGLMIKVSRLVAPLLRPLFPDLPENHRAWAPMIMNVSSNLLGLGNAATPFGIKAMKALDEDNKEKGTATKEMITFLALNTSAVSLFPGMILGFRAEAGSIEPTAIIIPSLLASLCGLTASLLTAKILAKWGGKR